MRHPVDLLESVARVSQDESEGRRSAAMAGAALVAALVGMALFLGVRAAEAGWLPALAAAWIAGNLAFLAAGFAVTGREGVRRDAIGSEGVAGSSSVPALVPVATITLPSSPHRPRSSSL